MKALLIIIIFGLAGASAQTKSYNNITRMCAEKHGLPFQEYGQYFRVMRDGGEKIMLFTECIFREFGYINDKGEILYDKFKHIPYFAISFEKYSSLVDSCKNEMGNNTAETSYKFFNCLLSNINQTYYEYRQHRQQHYQKQRAALKVCSAKTNLTIRNYWRYMKVMDTNGTQLQLFSECYLKELGYINSNGEILYEDIKKTQYASVFSNKFIRFIDQCKNEKGKNTSETSYKFLRCINSNINQTYFQIIEQYEKEDNAIKICSEENNVTIRWYDDLSKTLAADEEKIKLFSNCYLQNLGYLDSKGEILYDEVKKGCLRSTFPERISNFVEQCKSEKGTNSIETSHKFLKCFVTNIYQIYYHHRLIFEYMRSNYKRVVQPTKQPMEQNQNSSKLHND
ncbi:hypothetical protein FQA39_LY00464 [Lamprigera yunnana]|nr:hypothetical protein FQA39_LY00464 [Lamprigera yunnana]